jgi:hypothetical protein
MKLKIRLIYLLTLIVFCCLLITLVNVWVKTSIFNSSDEASNYIVTKEYWQNWKMSIDANYLDIDYWNNLHQRWFITHNQKLVPFNFLWTSFFYWPYYSYFWDYIKYINIFLYWIILLISVLFINWYQNRINMSILMLFNMPLIFYFNFPFFNIVPFIAFLNTWLYFILKFNSTWLFKNYIVWITLISVALFIRHEQILFFWVFYIINFIVYYKLYLSFLKYIILTNILLWVIIFYPLLFFNDILYWWYFNFWYSLFQKVFFPEILNQSQLTFEWLFIRAKDFNYLTLYNNVENVFYKIWKWYFVLWLLWYLHILYNSKKKVVIWLYTLVIIYIILYYWSSDTYWSWSGVENIQAAVMRYRLYIQILIVLMACYWITLLRNKLMSYILIVSVILVNFTWTWFNDLNDDIFIRKWYENKNEYLQNLWIEWNYIISPLWWKYLYLNNNIISRWWGTVDSTDHYLKTRNEIIWTVKFLLSQWEIIYVEESRYFSRHLQINDFEESWIMFEKISDNLYKLSI